MPYAGDRKERRQIKQINGVATIPVSSDHRNGDWIATDIYQGEFAQDTNTGAVHTRAGAETVSCGVFPNQVAVLKARVYQSGTGAPTIIPYYNPFGYTLGSLYDGVGIYTLTGFANEEFANTLHHYEMYWSPNYMSNGSLDITPATDTTIEIRSFNSAGALANDIIEELAAPTLAVWNVITIMRYKV